MLLEKKIVMWAKSYAAMLQKKTHLRPYFESESLGMMRDPNIKPIKKQDPMKPIIPGSVQVKLRVSGSTQFLKVFGEL